MGAAKYIIRFTICHKKFTIPITIPKNIVKYPIFISEIDTIIIYNIVDEK